MNKESQLENVRQATGAVAELQEKKVKSPRAPRGGLEVPPETFGTPSPEDKSSFEYEKDVRYQTKINPRRTPEFVQGTRRTPEKKNYGSRTFDPTSTSRKATNVGWRKIRKQLNQEFDYSVEEGKAYYAGLSSSVSAKRKSHFKKQTPMSDKDPSAYKAAPGDLTKSGDYKKTKESKHTKKYKEIYGEEMDYEINESAEAALRKKAAKSGISYGILKKVYNRGMAAWKTGHRPGATQQQWAFARVNSYITKGKGTYHGADKDLREGNVDEKCWDGYEAIGMKKKKGKMVPNCVPVKEEGGAGDVGTDELVNKYKSMTPGQQSRAKMILKIAKEKNNV